MRRLLSVLVTALVLAPILARPAPRQATYVHLDGCCCDAETPPDRCCCRDREKEPAAGDRWGTACRLPSGSEAVPDGTGSKALLPPCEDRSPARRATAVPDAVPGRAGTPTLRAPDHVPLLPA